MSDKVLLLYGAGANIGAGVLKKFSANGWKTAAVVRTMRDEYKDSADMVVQANFQDWKAIQGIYNDVESKLGTPSCVVYNAYSAEAGSTDRKIFAASPELYARDLAVNSVGSFAAASSAAAGFARLSSGPKTFIYTGNPLPTNIVPEFPGIGSGKAASAYFIEAAANELKDDSHWYFADERLSDGGSVMTHPSGEAHGEKYFELATTDMQGPWNHTFVKGEGYKRFEDTVDHRYFPLNDLIEKYGL